jgi:DNA-binding NtrC family response regulator
MASERDRLVTARLAEEAMGGPYSPSARVGWDTIERRVRLGAPLVVVAPNGSNVVSYLARAHITGPRARMPFVVVDGAKTSEHDALRWADATQSPLALAERGLLVIADAARLPRSVQQLIADALAQRRAPWEGAGPLDVSLALTTAGAARTMHDDLDLALVARLGDALAELVLWPHLRERGEDLRSLVLAGLAREGVRTRGAPLGIEDAAFEDLSNYEYPGEDAELASIVKRLSLVASGDVVTRGDVRSLGLGPETPAGR